MKIRFRLLVALLLTLSLLAIPIVTFAQVNDAQQNQQFSPIPQPVSDPSQVLPDSTPHLNIANPAHPDYGKIPPPVRPRHWFPRQPGEPPGPLPDPGQNDFGARVVNAAIRGIYAGHEVRTDFNLPAPPPNRTLYAPTVEAPNGAVLESVTGYWYYAGMQSTAKEYLVFNHLTGTWPVRKPLNDEFLNTYVGTYPDGRFYWTEVIQFNQGGPWEVLLYNFQTGTWERQGDPVSGTTGRQDGWDIWESEFNGTSPPIVEIKSKEVKIWGDGYGDWPRLTAVNGGSEINTMGGLPYSYGWVPDAYGDGRFYHWRVGP